MQGSSYFIVYCCIHLTQNACQLSVNLDGEWLLEKVVQKLTSTFFPRKRADILEIRFDSGVESYSPVKESTTHLIWQDCRVKKSKSLNSNEFEWIWTQSQQWMQFLSINLMGMYSCKLKLSRMRGTWTRIGIS